MKDKLRYSLFLLVLCLCTLGSPIGINHFVFGEGLNAEVRGSIGLLLLNFGFVVAFTLTRSPLAQRLGISFGLLLVTIKLFVNTFTIFLFIGLQAVRTHVFVPVFFAGYGVLLVGSVLLLAWNSKRI